MDKKLAENAFFNIIYKLLNVLFPLITSAYISRVLLADGVGKVEYARNLATIFVFIAALGIPAYGTKVIASLGDCDDQKKIDKNFSELLSMLIVSSTICFLIYLSIVLSVPKFSNEIVLYLATGLQIILVSINIDWLYQGKEIYKYITLRSFVVKACSLLCTIFFVKTKNDYIIYAFITSLAIAGNNIFNIIHSKKYVRFTIRELNISSHLTPVIILLLSTISGELYGKIDILMLGHFCTEINVGYYSNAMKVINTILTAITAITAVFLPRLSLLANVNRQKFSELAREGVKIISFITLPCCVGLALVSKSFVVMMFGEDFLGASSALCILCPLIIIKGIGDLLNYQVIISVGKEKYFLVTTTVAALINVIINYILIPVYQQNGAAFASVVSEIIVNGGMLFVSIKIISLRLDMCFLRTLLVSTSIMAGSVYGIQHIIFDTVPQLIISIITGCIIYLFVNYSLKNSLLYDMAKKIKNHKE